MSSDDGSDDEGRLADQLEELDVEVSGEDSDASSESGGGSNPERESDSRGAERDSESLDDEELFRRAVRDLDGESLHDEKFDEVDGGRDDWTGELERRDVPSDYDSEPADGTDEEAEDREPPAESREKSPTDMMEAALRDLDEEEIHERKFDDAVEGTDTADPPGSRAAGEATGGERRDEGSEGDDALDEEEARAEIQRRRERRQFETAVQDVDEIDGSDKRHRVDPPDPSEMLDGEERRSERTAEDFTTPTLPRSGDALDAIPALDEAQQSLLDRFEQSDVPEGPVELNLRGSTEREALHRLRGFVREAWERDQQFVRIVHGRGRRSDGLPVLKPAVLDWLESDGAAYVRGYAPERQPGGSYGSLVVELTVRRPS